MIQEIRYHISLDKAAHQVDNRGKKGFDGSVNNLDVVAAHSGSPIYGKTIDPITANLGEHGVLGFSLFDGSREQGGVSVITNRTAKIFGDAGQRAFERCAACCRVRRSSGFTAEQVTS